MDPTLRVFEIGRTGGDGRRGHLEVDLPLAWARDHSTARVAFEPAGPELGWHARMVGDSAEVLMSFPWYDRVDESLRKHPSETGFPIHLAEDGWDDFEQGWWARAIPTPHHVYLAQTDFDQLVDIADPTILHLLAPGRVMASGAEIHWNRVRRPAYDAAWQRAVGVCRAGLEPPSSRT